MIVDSLLILRDQAIGLIRIYFAKKRKISAKEMDFLRFTSRQSACAIETAGLIEMQRSQYQELALQTEKMSSLGRMAAGIAHEINNPLAGILLYSSSLIKKAPKEGPIREGLEVIINETKRCKAIIQDLLEFSRVGEPKTAFADVNGIIEKALSILENEFSLRHIHIEKHLSKKMEDVYLDEKQIQQVFVNVLLNAAQAIEKKGVITIRSLVGREQKCVRVEVVDSGPGIPEDHLPRIFEPFFSTKTNGTGLGLSVSYGIIQNHNGQIQASSQTGNGTRITIDFPLPGGSLAKGTGGGQNETS
jgi:signal transduction histidine kinase